MGLGRERVELIDSQGKSSMLHYSGISEIELDLGGYPSGLYFIRVYTEQGSVVKKVVVEYFFAWLHYSPPQLSVV